MNILSQPNLFFIQRFSLVFLFLTLVGCSGTPKKQVLEKPSPNIVLFLVDDMGWQDTSVPFWDKETPFNQRYQTPNMERLASEGMKFTQAYATPVCSPTRVSLMTGMNAARHRVTNWTLHKDALQPMEVNHKQLSFPRWNVNGLCPDPGLPYSVHADALPKLLKGAGYSTIHVGKAHFGAIDTPAEDPRAIGFDVNIAGHAAGAPQSYLGMDNFGNSETSKDSPWPVPGLEQYHGKDIFLTEALTQETLKVLDTIVGKESPFFLYMSHYAVHSPIMGDDRYLQKYLEAGLDSTEAKYATLVEGMDKSLGDIMDYLDKKQLTDNTIVLFMSDNGGLSVHARGGIPNTHNLPLASGKGSIYEGGIREPMIVKWPGTVKAGTENDNPLIIEDFYPSILEMAGVSHYEVVQKIDGKSFVPLLINNNAHQRDDRPLFWHYPNEWGPSGPGIGAFSAVRLGDWKLIYYHLDSRFELFNIAKDIGETINLATSEKAKVAELAKVLRDFLLAANAQMPSIKESGEQVALP